jgi:hypothetical protein
MVREILDPSLVERFLASAEVISRIERCLETANLQLGRLLLYH